MWPNGLRIRWPILGTAPDPGPEVDREPRAEDEHELLRLEFLLTSWRRTAVPTDEEAALLRPVLSARLSGADLSDGGAATDLADLAYLERDPSGTLASALASGRPVAPFLRSSGVAVAYPRTDAALSLVWLAAGEGDALAHAWLAGALGRRPAAEAALTGPLIAEHLESAGLARMSWDGPGLRALAAGILVGSVPPAAARTVPDHAGAVRAHLDALSALRLEPGWRDRLAEAAERAQAAAGRPAPRVADDDLDFLCASSEMPMPPPPPLPPELAGARTLDVAPGFSASQPHLRAYAGLERPLPLLPTRDAAGLESRLAERLPWMLEPVRHVARSQRLRARGSSPWFGFAPILLVGPAGLGKTRFARTVSEEAGVPLKMLNAAGQSGAIEILGHSPSYREAHPSAPIEAMVRLRAANPILFVDEIDKFGSSDWNGSPHDALLPMLEEETARAFHDEYLRQVTDVSQVSYIFTANSLAGLPPELLDRVEVFRIAPPTPEQVREIVGTLIAETGAEFGLAPDEAPPLRPEFVDGLGRLFDQGASLRKVRRAIRGALLASADHAPH